MRTRAGLTIYPDPFSERFGVDSSNAIMGLRLLHSDAVLALAALYFETEGALTALSS